MNALLHDAQVLVLTRLEAKMRGKLEYTAICYRLKVLINDLPELPILTQSSCG